MPTSSRPHRISCAMASFLSYLSYPIFQKMQGFPCEFFVMAGCSMYFDKGQQNLAGIYSPIWVESEALYERESEAV